MALHRAIAAKNNAQAAEIPSAASSVATLTVAKYDRHGLASIHRVDFVDRFWLADRMT
jgi:hypothetical protein